MRALASLLVFTWGALPAFAAGTVTVHTGARAEVPEAVFFAFALDTIPFRRNLELTLVPATKHPEPVLRRGPRGAFDELRAEYFGTVLRIGGKFRMWYVGYGFEDPSNRTYIWYGTWDLTTSGGPQVNLSADLLAEHGDVGLMTLRRDGFGYVSVLDPKSLRRMATYGDGKGSLLTVPFRVAGGSASVAANLELGGGGRLAMELLDGNGMPIVGYGAADFVAPEQGGRAGAGALASAPDRSPGSLPDAGPHRACRRGLPEAVRVLRDRHVT